MLFCLGLFPVRICGDAFPHILCASAPTTLRHRSLGQESGYLFFSSHSIWNKLKTKLQTLNIVHRPRNNLLIGLLGWFGDHSIPHPWIPEYPNHIGSTPSDIGSIPNPWIPHGCCYPCALILTGNQPRLFSFRGFVECSRTSQVRNTKHGPALKSWRSGQVCCFSILYWICLIFKTCQTL
jgi:hypothetical protein